MAWKHFIGLTLPLVVQAALTSNCTDLDTLACPFNPDVDLPTLEIIRRQGYPAEGHVIQTDDGYLLTLHRIPHSKDQGSKPVVFLQHGLLASSADWVIAGPDRALAYILHDAGYDVWMGNARGNTYSRNHVTFSTSDPAFWDFSFHQMGVFDLPAAFDHILNTTGQSNLSYIGHSMGTTMFYAMASTRPEYNSKIRTMISLAPVAIMQHVKSPLRLLGPWADDIESIAHFFGANEFLPQTKILRLLSKYGCDAVATEVKICENILFILCGYDDQQFNKTLLPVIFGHTPAGTATKVLVHFAQLIRSGKFQQYDKGAEGNQAAYGQLTPPEYNFTNIDIPVTLMVGKNDWLASLTDAASIAKRLPRLMETYVVSLPMFNHLDFLWGNDVKTLVYDKVEAILRNHTTAKNI